MSSFQKSAENTCLKMRALFPETPLQKNEYLSNIYGANIYLKREDLSPVRSYKIRGAFNSIKKAIAQNSGIKNFVCASAGNHAQGVAFVCKYLNMSGHIFMPVTTPQQKIDKTYFCFFLFLFDCLLFLFRSMFFTFFVKEEKLLPEIEGV